MEDSVFNIVDTVEEVVSSVSPQACEKDLELISVVDPQIPRFLRGDSRRLRQVLLNFLRYLPSPSIFTSVLHPPPLPSPPLVLLYFSHLCITVMR